MKFPVGGFGAVNDGSRLNEMPQKSNLNIRNFFYQYFWSLRSKTWLYSLINFENLGVNNNMTIRFDQKLYVSALIFLSLWNILG